MNQVLDALGPTGSIAAGLAITGLATALGAEKGRQLIDKVAGKDGKGGLGGLLGKSDCINLCAGASPGGKTTTETPGGTTPGGATPTATPGGTTPGGATPTATPGGATPTATPTGAPLTRMQKIKQFARRPTVKAAGKYGTYAALLGAAGGAAAAYMYNKEDNEEESTDSKGTALSSILNTTSTLTGMGSTLLPLVKGASSLTGIASKIPVIGNMLAGISAITGAGSIMSDGTKDTSGKIADTAALAASTALRFNPITGGLLFGKDMLAMGAGAMGMDNVQNKLNLIDPSSAPALGEYIGKSFFEMMNPDHGSMVSSVSPAMSSSYAPSQNTTQATQYSQATASSSAAQQPQSMAPGSVMSQAKSTSMTLNPDGSRQFDFALTIPGFDQAVAQTMRIVSENKPAGSR
jgi:hypothetical protein